MFTIYKGAKRIGQTADTSFLVDGLSPDTEYTLGVSRTVDGVESAITKVSSKTKPLPTKPLNPTGLRVTQKDEKSITVVWNKVAGERYNIYLGDAQVKQGDDSGTYTFGGLLQDKEYVISVEATRNGMTSEAASLTARTDKIKPPFDVVAKEVSDRFITITWDSDEVIGEGMYNMYLDNVLQIGDFKGREFTYDKLQPSTEYKLCVSVVRDNQETAKSSIFVTTHAPIGEGEPPVPDVSELDNLASAYGDFEVFEGGVPMGWHPDEEAKDGMTQDTTWKKHGASSLRMTIPDNSTFSAAITDAIDDELQPGIYLAIVDFRAPENAKQIVKDTEGNEIEVWKYKVSLGVSDQVQLQQENTETIIYAAFKHDGGSAYVSLGINDLTRERDLVANFDALRIYKITPELYNYIKGGQMHRDRIAEVFPYVDSQSVTPASAIDEQDVSAYHVGGGYYDIDGERVRGKEAAQTLLSNKEVE